MFTSSVQSARDSKRTVAAPSLGCDFALLGLHSSEARVEIIRQAAQKTARRIQLAAAGDPTAADVLLSDLASSTYRLLDPRRRVKMMERIQLSLSSEQDQELQRDSREPLLPPSRATTTQAAPKPFASQTVTASAVSGPAATVHSVTAHAVAAGADAVRSKAVRCDAVHSGAVQVVAAGAGGEFAESAEGYVRPKKRPLPRRRSSRRCRRGTLVWSCTLLFSAVSALLRWLAA